MRQLLLTRCLDLLYASLSLFYPTNFSSNIRKLSFLGLGLALFFLYVTDFTFPGGAYHFTTYAEALASGGVLNPSIAQRDVGYPLLLLLSGYPYHHSLVPIVIMQSLMAISMPVMCYCAIRLYFPRVAYYASLIMLCSMVPFIYMKWIHHDQAYMFFTILSVTLLNYYLKLKKDAYLYAMTLAVIAASLTRPAGNLLFPVFITVAFCFVRRGYVKYLISIFIFLIAIGLYAHHRNLVFEMHKYDHMPSYTGEQIFYNLYINSKEYGIKLSPTLGPNMDLIAKNAYNLVFPSPRLSISFNSLMVNEPDYFLKEHFYPYSANAFVKQMYLDPNWEYYAFICGVAPDSTLLGASFEIMKQYPWYPLEYTMRNVWLLLYEPGYAHTRYNVQPMGKQGLQNAFSFSVSAVDNAQFKGLLADKAFQELSYDAFENQSRSLQKKYHKVRKFFYKHFEPLVKFLFYLMSIAWLSVLLGLVAKATRLNSLQTISRYLLSDTVMAPIIGVSGVLLESILITAMFAEPDFRYHNFVVPLKIILAGFGLGVLINLFLQFFTGGVDSAQECASNAATKVEANSFLLNMLTALIVIMPLLYWGYSILLKT